MKATGFHNCRRPRGDLRQPAVAELTRIRERTLSYRFDTHFHPYVSELVDRLVAGLRAGPAGRGHGVLVDRTARW